MPLIKVVYLDSRDIHNDPVLLDGVLNTDCIVAAMEYKARIRGCFLDVLLKDGSHVIIRGIADTLLVEK